MLHGILFILKIIGILLLAVLGLILAAALLILLVPVRYRVEASVFEKRPDVDVRVTWLLHLISVRCRYHPQGGPFDLAVRILGIRLGGRKKNGKDEDGEMRLRDQSGEGSESEESDSEFGEEQLLELLEKGLEDEDGSPGETKEEGTAGTISEASAEQMDGTAKSGEVSADSKEGLAKIARISADSEEGLTKADETPANSDEDEWERFFAEDGTDSAFSDTAGMTGAEKEKSSPADKIRRLIEKIRDILRGIPKGAERLKRSVEKLAEKKNSLMEFIQDADNQSLFRLLLKQTGGVFRHIRPGKLRLYLHFGFTDPSLTGKLLGYASVFYAYYYKTVDLVPEFQTDTLILEGNLYAKGRVRAGTLLCKGLRLLFNKGCRKLIKRVLKK